MPASDPPRFEAIERATKDVGAFSQALVRRPLRHYQLQAARAILHSVHHRQGRVFTVVKAAQSACFWADTSCSRLGDQSVRLATSWLRPRFLLSRGTTFVKEPS